MDSDKSFEISLLWIPETSIMIPLAEFKEFEPRFKSVKIRQTPV